MVVVTNQSLSVQTYCETATLVQNLVRQQIYMMTHQSWIWVHKDFQQDEGEITLK